MNRHGVQFFDSPDSLGTDVARFFKEGLDVGARLVLIARPIHVKAIAEGLATWGADVATLEADGRLSTIDLATTLRRLIYNSRPHPDMFDRIIGHRVKVLAAQGPVRAYGELVDVLAADGNIRASQELEDLWNRLLETTPIQLHCGYTAATFADARSARAMRSICEQHTHVCSNRSDLLAEWLLSQHAS